MRKLLRFSLRGSETMGQLLKTATILAVLAGLFVVEGTEAEALPNCASAPRPGPISIAEPAKCACGPSGCTCGRAWAGYRYKNYGFGTVRPYASSGKGASYRFRARP